MFLSIICSYVSTFNFKNLARFRWAFENLYGILCLTIIYGGKNGKYIRIYIKEQKDFSRARLARKPRRFLPITAISALSVGHLAILLKIFKKNKKNMTVVD